MSKSKALLFDLSGSISFGRLSLLGKVLFPMLVLKSDDQGRGLAEPDAIKWKVCPSVQELTIEAIEDVLQEMVDERIDLLRLYQDSRGRSLYQFKRWWVPEIGSGSCLQWARPSEYEAPAGWVDRIRLQQGPGKPPLVQNWDSPGGFVEAEMPRKVEDNPPPSAEAASELGNQVGIQVPNVGHEEQNNLTQPNPTEEKAESGAAAPSPDGDHPSPNAEIPKGEPEQPSTFQDWSELLQVSGNRPAVLVRMFEALYPGRDPPDFGYMGKVARQLGGAGRMAELLWQNSTRPPTGDVLAYCLAVGKRGKDNGNGTEQRVAQPIRLSDDHYTSSAN